MKLSFHSLMVGSAVSITLLTTGCGIGVKSAEVGGYTEGTSAFVDVKATFELAGMSFAGLSYNIPDPKDSSSTIGKISLDGTTVTLLVDITKASHVDTTENTLPNGSVIPVDHKEVPVIAIPLGTKGSRVYLAYGPGVALLGVAVNVKEFQKAQKWVPGTVLMPAFTFKNVKGNGGVYVGTDKATSGAALFVDFASVIGGSPSEPNRLAFFEGNATLDHQKRLAVGFHKMGKKGTILNTDF